MGRTMDEAAAGPAYAEIDFFTDWGIRALMTTRLAGSFSTAGDEPVGAVLGRWTALQRAIAGGATGRFATATQVHGAEVTVHDGEWTGWLRGAPADGHLAPRRGTAVAVTVADCVPVFVAHPSGAIALLHSGWRGTEAGILPAALALLSARGLAASDLRVYLGPAICGTCYEVSPDVYGRLTGRTVLAPTPVDLRGIIARQAAAGGIRAVAVAPECTRCDNDRYFSHRAGDSGRQLGVMTGGDSSP